MGWTTSPLVSPSASHTDQRKARHQTTITHEPDVYEEVKRRVEQWLWQLRLSIVASSDDSFSSDEEQPSTRKRHPLKSGMNHTGETTVIKWIMWAHEVQYTAAGKPAYYEDLSVSAFVQGYLTIMKSDHTETSWWGIVIRMAGTMYGQTTASGWIN